MNFKEIYERYQAGTATEEERVAVEEELEKYRLLTERLAEEDDFPGTWEPGPAEQGEFKRVKKTMRRRTLTIVLASVVLACGLFIGGVILWQKALVPFLNEHVFYNPDTYTYDKWSSDLEVELYTFTELFCPQNWVQDVTAESTGLGSYRLRINMPEFFSAPRIYNKIIYGTVAPGKIELDDEFFRMCVINLFSHATAPYAEGDNGNEWPKPEETLPGVAELPDYTYLRMSISFHQDLSMEDLAGLVEAYPEISFRWAGVRNSERDVQRLPLMGFAPDSSGIMFEEDLLEAYPYLQIYRYKEEEPLAELYTKHIRALLQYQIDNAVLWKYSSQNVPKSYFEEQLDYLEQNGAYTYGVYVEGRPSELLKLCNDLEDNICHAAVEQMKLQTK